MITGLITPKISAQVEDLTPILISSNQDEIGNNLPPVINLDPPSSTNETLVSVETKTRFDKLPTTNQDLSNLSLPISSHLPAIAKTFQEVDQILITAATGTGKSLGIPWILGRNGNRVVISVPTVAAAKSLTARQGFLNPEIQVGYAAEGEIHYSSETRIIYATSGHVRRRFLDFYRQGTGLISKTDVLILDEIHLGLIDDFVNYSIWKYSKQIGRQVPKLGLSSATPDEQKYPGILIYNIPTKSYPVKLLYHTKNYSTGDRRLIGDLIDVIYQFHISELTGDILVFVAGKGEINRVILGLKRVLDDELKNAVLIPVHSDLSPSEFSRIHQRFDVSRETGRRIENPPRKIIVSTNIAETSITIEDVNLVIDSMMEKRAETSSTGGFRLSLHHISQSSAIQREGRTGRTGPGYCYRMCTRNFFLKLEKNRPDEILRVPIYNTIMEIMEVGLDPSRVLIGVDQPSIRLAVSLLTQLELITVSGQVTPIGHFVTNFPLSVRNAVTLWLWIQKGLPIYPGIVVLSLIDSYGPSYFWYPFQTPGESNSQYHQKLLSHKEKYFSSIEGYSDVDSILNMWNDMTSIVGGPKANHKQITSWSVSNSINNRKLKEAIRIINQVKNSVRRLGYKFKVGPFTTQGVVKELRPLVEITYYDLIMTLVPDSQVSYYHSGSKNTYRLDQRNSVNRLSQKLPSKIIPLVRAEIQTGGTIHLISLALDVLETEKV